MVIFIQPIQAYYLQYGLMTVETILLIILSFPISKHKNKLRFLKILFWGPCYGKVELPKAGGEEKWKKGVERDGTGTKLSDQEWWGEKSMKGMGL